MYDLQNKLKFSVTVDGNANYYGKCCIMLFKVFF